MQENCANAHDLCGCVDRHNIDTLLLHMVKNFVPEGFSLECHTLEPEDGRMFCHVGRCRTCGKRLCHGIDLPADSTREELLARIYRWMYRVNQICGVRLDQASDFRDVFLSVFHEEDRDFVKDWLEKSKAKEECT